MKRQHKTGLLCGLALAALAIPAALVGQDQDAPESLLPPGFGTPTPSPTPAPAPAPTPSPATPAPPASPAAPVPATPTPSETVQQLPEPAAPEAPEEPVTDTSEDFGSSPGTYDIPAASRRSLTQTGIIGIDQGGFASDSFSGTDGGYLVALMNNTRAPLISRWGSILLRRALASNVQTPARVNGADWVAARSGLLLQMGEADNARMLIQTVDTPLYTPLLYNAAMRTYLANADPSGLCPIVIGGAQASDDIRWDMSRAICSAMSGETSAAASRIDRLNREGKAPQIDLLLAEKTVGAGGGRGAVTVEWEGVDEVTPWRFGLALATGIEPPAELMVDAGEQYRAWQSSAPMISLEGRVASADISAAIGVLSSNAMIDLYSAAYDSPETAEDVRARASLLRRAYAAPETADRIESMRNLWDRSDDPKTRYGSYVLTSHAAARFPVSEDYTGDADRLIASMLSAGLDRNAVRWASIAEIGSDGWAMLALATPGLKSQVEFSSLDSYYDNDYSEDSVKSGFLIAGLAGLGRVSEETRTDFEDKLDISLSSNSRWARAITTAADADKPAVVAVLAAVGMQGADWSAMSPAHLYYIVRSLNKVGLEAEARMIAAEAIARG